jgi:hypothetical protein
VINPGKIVLGGSVAQIYPHVQQRVQNTVEKEFLAGFPLPDIGLPSSNTGGTAFGAACLLHQFMFSVDEEIVHATGDSPMPSSVVEQSALDAKRTVVRDANWLTPLNSTISIHASAQRSVTLALLFFRAGALVPGAQKNPVLNLHGI